jgi:hypothetical protein
VLGLLGVMLSCFSYSLRFEAIVLLADFATIDVLIESCSNRHARFRFAFRFVFRRKARL